ncbi:diadenylate cyclase CdaA [Psychroflexus salis]|uniref:Diadenylate cyclase n=1 Tax=Psychroflexus salis TaxID=1526574 RepID=A0A916ZRZ1_9FLAO|nr:diadenylate cyclase CdaA [Psychroflexus salis]GGE09951.1 membrane protein [Psychroflexus salis]
MGLDFLDIGFFDILDILLVAFLLFYIYRLVKGSAAINIFIGIVIIYLLWQLTLLLNMEMFSNVLGQFIGVGMFALIVVFQQEIRKFLLMIGSTNFSSKKGFLQKINFSSKSLDDLAYLEDLVEACQNMGSTKTGALIVLQRNTKLDFVKNTGDEMQIEFNIPILESIFYKNSPLHDGAIVIEDAKITATRVILPVSNDRNIPLRFGLRHRAAIGITEKTDALALVVSEETGQISYIKDGEFRIFNNEKDLVKKLQNDMQ